MGNKKLTITIEPWAYEELNRLLQSDYSKGRGFKMTKSILIEEMIANYGRFIEFVMKLDDDHITGAKA